MSRNVFEHAHVQISVRISVFPRRRCRSDECGHASRSKRSSKVAKNLTTWSSRRRRTIGNRSPSAIGRPTVGRAMVGTRYKSFTLEIDDRVEAPSANFFGMDCWTFFEIALGFARMLNEPQAEWTPGDVAALCRARSLSGRPAAPANIFPACITLRIGSRTTIDADWWKILPASWVGCARITPRRK